MYLYHGTPADFDVPTLNKCKPHRDFGCGFYLATNYFDALPMAVKNSRVGYVQTYLLTDLDGLSVLEFDERSEDWLRFVVSSRLGTAPNVDLVIGYMAGGGSNLKSKFTKLRNSNVSIDVAATAMRKQLTSTQLGVQYAFLTEKALSKLVKTHILVSAVEHDSVLRAAESLIKDGFHVEYIPVSSECRVSPAVIEDALRADTGLVSVMFANNETGAINPIEDIGTICMKRGILFHTDCVQAAGCYPIDVVKIGCDFLSVSSHKIHGCKGIGALYAKDKSKLTPIVYGGSEQEFGLRGGTENVAGIVGFGKACEISSKSLHEDTVWVSTLKQRFFMALNEALKDTGDESCVHVNGMSILTPGKTINLRMDGVDGETLLLMLDGKGVCVSAGSACRSHEAEPSHVLSAMGLSKDEARSSIRISFSKKNTADEAVRAAQILAGCISALRAREEKE